MNSKQIGNIGEAKVLSKFIELGFPVYIPFGDNEKADLVVEFNGKLNKVQVKTSIDAKNGNVIFDLTSSTAHRKMVCAINIQLMKLIILLYTTCVEIKYIY